MLVADNENNGRKEVMTLEANLMTFPDRRLLHPLLLHANNHNNGAGSVPADARQVRSYTGDEEEIA